jgi:hypothetical protein
MEENIVIEKENIVIEKENIVIEKNNSEIENINADKLNEITISQLKAEIERLSHEKEALKAETQMVALKGSSILDDISYREKMKQREAEYEALLLETKIREQEMLHSGEIREQKLIENFMSEIEKQKALKEEALKYVEFLNKSKENAFHKKNICNKKQNNFKEEQPLMSRAVYQETMSNNNNKSIYAEEDFYNDEVVSEDISGNLTDASDNLIITFKKYTYKEIEKEINDNYDFHKN